MSSIIINGAISDHIDINDRGLQYGDGLFETIAIKNHKLLMWHQHLARLSHGCEVLGLAEINEQQWLEDIRALNWTSIKNIGAGWKLAGTLSGRRLGYSPQLKASRIKLLRIGKPIFLEKAKMTLYMISESIKEAMKDVAAAFRELRNNMENNIQLELPL